MEMKNCSRISHFKSESQTVCGAFCGKRHGEKPIQSVLHQLVSVPCHEDPRLDTFRRSIPCFSASKRSGALYPMHLRIWITWCQTREVNAGSKNPPISSTS